MKWTPADIVVLIITISITCAFLFIHVRSVLTTVFLPDESTKVIQQIYLAYIAIISMYVGARIKGKR